MKKSIGIYIHIPFCVQKCKYCDFCSFQGMDSNIRERYKNALIFNIQRVAKHFKDRTVDTIFFGGGTPTTLSSKDLNEILNTVFENYFVSNDTEITIECNPATIDKFSLLSLRANGFNRLSLGLQSIHASELKALGRIHLFEEFMETYDNARQAKFDNINVDLMYGIPFQDENSFMQTLNTVSNLAPEHISVYGLQLEKGTELYRNRENLILPDEEAEYNMYKLADHIISNFGYEHYEISNYARPGKRSKHNIKYWSCDEYLGFGVSAHSLINKNRYYVTDSVKKYISYFENGSSTPYFSIEETLTDSGLAEEYIMMRLRLKDGLSRSIFEQKFSKVSIQKYIEKMTRFIESGHIIYDSDRYFLTPDGMYISNYILSDILEL